MLMDVAVKVVEEWVCWCGALNQMSVSKCKVCGETRQPDAKIVARRATPEEVLHRLSDKVCGLNTSMEIILGLPG